MGIAQALCSGPSNDAFNLLWLDERVPANDYHKTVPTAHWYDDIETVFTRNAWDADATHVAFVCRPLGGHKYAELCQRYGIGGTGHNHPEQNHFTLFGRGELLAIDPGYTYEKETRNHNTVLVGGKGQYGAGEMWPEPSPGRAHITHFVNDGDVTIVVGDATSAYPPERGLKQFERTLVVVGRDLVVIYDRLAAERPTSFSWLLHHHGTIEQRDHCWTVTRGGAQLSILPLLPDAFRARISTYRPQYIHPTRNLTPKNPDIGLLEFDTKPVTEATFLVPLIVADAGAKVPACPLSRTPTSDSITIGSICVAFNRTEADMTVPLPWGQVLKTPARALVARIEQGRQQVVVARKSR